MKAHETKFVMNKIARRTLIASDRFNVNKLTSKRDHIHDPKENTLTLAVNT